MDIPLPRNSSGTYSIPIAAFVPGGLIKSSDDNTNFSDIGLALTQSLATTGVSTMTGQLVGSAGLVSAPGYTFSGAPKTGFYLAGANQIGIATNGIQAATVNSDQSVTFAGTIAAAKGTIPVGFVGDFAGSTAPAGWLLCFGQLVSTTTYAALFAVLSTTYGSGAGTFGIPDYRGRSTFGQDNMGGVAANRITATLNFDGTVLGATGGNQSHTLTGGESAVLTYTATITQTVFQRDPAQIQNVASGGGVQFATWTGGPVNNVAPQQPTFSITGNAGGNPHTILNPAAITNKIIFAGI